MLQIFINSLINGLAIGSIALAFSLVYRPTRVFFLALGGLYALAPHFALWLMNKGLHWTIACTSSVLLCAIVSCGCEALSHSRLEQRGVTALNHLVASLGIYIILVQLTVLLWGSNAKVFPAHQDRLSESLRAVFLAQSQMTMGLVLLIALSILGVWMTKSKLGLLLRGLTCNPIEMQLLGRPVPALRLLAFALSGCLVAIVSLVKANDVGFDPFVGLPAILLGIVAVIIGGRDSFIGPVIAGVILGLVRSTTSWYSPKWQEAVTFLLLGFFLLVLPNGLFSRSTSMEADS